MDECHYDSVYDEKDSGDDIDYEEEIENMSEEENDEQKRINEKRKERLNKLGLRSNTKEKVNCVFNLNFRIE